jgi:hypothetical protein
MDEVTSNRREFLKTTTGLLTGLVVAGSPLALIAPGRAWAVDLTAFTSFEAATLMAVARTIAPHDKLDDAAYALVIRSWTPMRRKTQACEKCSRKALAGSERSF